MDINKAAEAKKILDDRDQQILSSVAEEAIRQDERRKIWKEVNAQINLGDLPGNGCDEVAQRNGMILAANIIAEGLGEFDGS